MAQNHTTAVLSIGGNALNHSKNLDNLLEAIYLLSKKGSLVITHGNGPQVGELASIERGSLSLLTAQTDAQIGLFLQEEITKYFALRNQKVKVETVITKILVDPKERAFKYPTKPIGNFYSKAQSQKLPGTFRKLIGGYRRVAASPRPIKVINLDSLKLLLKKKYIVIAGGGGGVPIFYKGKSFYFADAVIDKDYTSSLIATSINASFLFTLTNVDGAFIGFKNKNQELIERISAKEMSKFVAEGIFEEGSMLPKVQAALAFVRSKKHRAVIGNLKNAKDVIDFKGCTVITP